MTKLRFHHQKIEIWDKTGNIEMFSYCDIMYMIYEKPYTSMICMENGKTKKIILQISLIHMLRQLPVVFFRCSPKFIINLIYFKKYIYSEKQILMKDGRMFDVSRRKWNEFQSKLALLPRLSPLCNPCLTCTNACSIKDCFCTKEKNNLLTPEK